MAEDDKLVPRTFCLTGRGGDRRSALAEENITIIEEEKSGLTPKKGTHSEGSSNGKRGEIIMNGTNQNSNVSIPCWKSVLAERGRIEVGKTVQIVKVMEAESQPMNLYGVKDLSELLFCKKFPVLM